MAGIVIISAAWNIILSLISIASAMQHLAANEMAMAYHSLFFGAFLLYTSATLVLAARNLPDRASIIFWEGYLRFAAALILLTIGPNAIGPMAWPLAFADLAWGIIYQYGLCRTLARTYSQLLLDRTS